MEWINPIFSTSTIFDNSHNNNSNGDDTCPKEKKDNEMSFGQWLRKIEEGRPKD